MLELFLPHTMSYLTAVDLVRLTRASHGMYRVAAALLSTHMIDRFGPGCLSHDKSKGSILSLLHLLERSVVRPEDGTTRRLVELMPERWSVQESSKFKYQLVAADSVVGLERALAHGCQLHSHMANCARSVAMCQFLASRGILPTNQGVTIALSNNLTEVADWMMDQGLVPVPSKQLVKSSPALGEYALTHPEATPDFIRYVARVANRSHDYELVQSLVERHGVHSDDGFLPMLRKAPLDFVAWVLTQKLVANAEIMKEAITARRLDMMQLIPGPLKPGHVTSTLLSHTVEVGRLDMVEWALQQEWGPQSTVMAAAVKSGEVAKVRLLLQQYPLRESAANVALRSPHCTVAMLQYLSEHKMWPSRESAGNYVTGTILRVTHHYQFNANPEVVAWLKSHYWWI